MPSLKYKRILLKVSGEGLSGTGGFGLDPDNLEILATQITELVHQTVQPAIVVGGGNFIVPVLVWLGIEPKKASATTSFIVIFPSFSGFLGHASLGAFDYSLMSFTALGSVAGAMVGAWLMIEKLKQRQVKLIIGVVLVGIAARMAWTLIM